MIPDPLEQKIPLGEIHRWDGTPENAQKILQAVLGMEPGDAMLSFGKKGSAPILLKRSVIEALWADTEKGGPT